MKVTRMKRILGQAIICLLIAIMVIAAPVMAFATEGEETITEEPRLSKQPDGTYHYYVGDTWQSEYTGLYLHPNGNYFFINNGVWKNTYKGLMYSSEGSYAIQKGIWKAGYDGLFLNPEDSTYYYLKNGICQSGYTGLYLHPNGKYYYIENGAWKNTYQGFLYGSDGRYAIQKGIWKAGYNGLFLNPQDSKYYYLVNGICQDGYTGLYKHPNSKYYYIVNGVWNSGYKGFYNHPNQKLYAIQNGIWKEGYKGLFLNPEDSLYHYLVNGVWQETHTGLYLHPNNKYYYIENGIWKSKYVGLYLHPNKKYYAIENGIWNRRNTTTAFEGNDYVVMDGIASKVVTESDRTLWRAIKVVNSITTDDMTDAQKLRVCFDHVRTKYSECRPRTPHYTGMDWPVVYANDMFVRGKGNCCSYGAAFAYLAKAIGYKEVYACNSGGHGWAEVNGLVYDPEWSLHGPILHPQYGPYDYYGTTYSPQRTDMNYKGGIAPGRSYMRIKI